VRQRGAVLIAMVLAVLIVTGTGLLASGVALSQKLAAQREVTTSLAKAREALISYAVTYTDNYGHNTRGGVGRLPCPSSRPHSSPALSCGRNAIGYLPAVWSRGNKRIEIDYLEYFLKQNLWYAVSPEFRYNPAHNALNPSVKAGLLQLNSYDDVVAVVIHPGEPQAGQNRAAVNADIHAFLEKENADGDNVYEMGVENNDRIVAITKKELMPLMERRVLGIVRDWLMEYYDENKYFPFAARLGDPTAACEEGLLVGVVALSQGNCVMPSLGALLNDTIPKGRTVAQTWFGRYDWSRFMYYHLDVACTSTAPVDDCLNNGVGFQLTVDDDPVPALLISVGDEIVSSYAGVQQNRFMQPQSRASYLDSAALVEAVLSYDLTQDPNDPHINDQLMVVR
jgi:hypothetical protein